MTGFTSLKALTLITKLYTGYAYSLAFLFQSSIVLLMAAFATVTYIVIKDRSNSITENRPALITRQHQN